jgi:hypothetical protein
MLQIMIVVVVHKDTVAVAGHRVAADTAVAVHKAAAAVARRDIVVVAAVHRAVVVVEHMAVAHKVVAAAVHRAVVVVVATVRTVAAVVDRGLSPGLSWFFVCFCSP